MQPDIMHKQATAADELFDTAYEREVEVFGAAPSGPLMQYVTTAAMTGAALDIGAGLGRNALALASAGFRVTAVDRSRSGVRRLAERAEHAGLGDRVDARAADIREMSLGTDQYDVIVAATVIDHMSLDDATALLPVLHEALRDDGAIYIDVLTTDDPGCSGVGQASEFVAAIEHYFAPNELPGLAARYWRIACYLEQREHDTTHGAPHDHVKAKLLGLGPAAPLVTFQADDSNNPTTSA